MNNIVEFIKTTAGGIGKRFTELNKDRRLEGMLIGGGVSMVTATVVELIKLDMHSKIYSDPTTGITWRLKRAMNLDEQKAIHKALYKNDDILELLEQFGLID